MALPVLDLITVMLIFSPGAAAWSLHNENWFRDMLPTISKVKFRASYGQLGNQDIGDYPWASVVTQGYNYILGHSSQERSGLYHFQQGQSGCKMGIFDTG